MALIATDLPEPVKTTLAEQSPEGPRIRYEEVDIQYLAPTPRRYDED